jgi:hypothetical protein
MKLIFSPKEIYSRNFTTFGNKRWVASTSSWLHNLYTEGMKKGYFSAMKVEGGKKTGVL